VLRREVEPVDPVALARFLPGWQGVGGTVPGVDRTLEVIEQLQGAAIPASVLEADVLPQRVRAYTTAWLDELCAAGEVVWVGQGALGADDGRVGLYLRDQAPLLAPLPDLDAVRAQDWWTDRHAGVLGHLVERGASFWPALYAAAGQSASEADVLEVLWDLVWAGLVTNDTPAPLRALVGGGVRRGAGRSLRRRPGRVASRAGPPRAAGRWSLVADVMGAPPSPTERAAATAARLLDRHGVVTRDAVTAEDVQGGFAAVYAVLKVMEESGRARRGYFVEGLGGSQFALPGAVDRLRALRDPASVGGRDDDAVRGALALAATDPANPYGAALPWPSPADGRGKARRAAGAHVALVDGELVAYSERGGRSLVTFTDAADALAAAAAALAGLVDRGAVARLAYQRIDGEPPVDQPVVASLRAAGFVDHPRGLIRRAGPR
jgi:ATP-dependent helicase Lhr and Lhr-like helicase